MSLSKKKKPGDLAEKKSGTNLTREDLATVLRYVRAGNKTEAEVLRELVHEAIVSRQLKERGKTDAEDRYRQLQREAVHVEVDAVRKELVNTNELIRRQTGLLERVLVKAAEGAALDAVILERAEGIYVLCENYWTKDSLKKKGLTEADIAKQLKMNRLVFAEEVIPIISNAQALARGFGNGRNDRGGEEEDE